MGAALESLDWAIDDNRLRLEVDRLDRRHREEMRRALIGIKDVDVQSLQDATGEVATGGASTSTALALVEADPHRGDNHYDHTIKTAGPMAHIGSHGHRHTRRPGG